VCRHREKREADKRKMKGGRKESISRERERSGAKRDEIIEKGTEAKECT
jgi:hypothetical protein